MEWGNIIAELVKEVMVARNGDCISLALNRELSAIQYEALNSEDEIYFIAELEEISDHPTEWIEYDIQPWSIELKVRNFNGGDCYLKICRLADEIDPDETEYITLPDAICFNLRKVKRRKWSHVHYHHPEVLKNFNASLDEFVRSSPALQDQNNTDLFCMWVVENCICAGVELRSMLPDYGIDLPSDVITIDQILEFLKVDSLSAPRMFEYTLIGAAVYLNEKRKYEETYPEIVREYDKHPETKRISYRKRAEELEERGNSFTKNKNFYEATKAFSQAIKLDPQCPTFYLGRANAYFNLEIFTTCLQDAAKAISLDPFYGRAYLTLGVCFMSQTFTEDAITVLKKAKLLDPEDRDVDKQLASAYRLKHNIQSYVEAVRSRNEEERETHLKEVTKSVDPSTAAERMLKLLCDKGMIAEAKIEATKLCRIHRMKEAIKFYLLAICFYYEDNEEKFRENFWKSRGKYSRLGKIVEGNAYCDSIEEIYSHRSKGDKMFNNGGYEDAITWYSKALAIDEIIPVVSAKLRYKIACAYHKLNKIVEAIDNLSIAIRKKEDYHEAIAARGEHYLRQRVFASALEDFEKAYSLSPCARYQGLINKAKLKQPMDNETTASEKSSAQNNDKKAQMQKTLAASKKQKGNKQFEAKRYKEAIDSYSEAIELDADNPVYYSNRAACHVILKDFAEGLRDAEKAVSLDSLFVKGLFRMSQCYVAFGKPDKALIALKKANKLKTDKGLMAELVRANNLKENVEKGNSAFEKKDYKNAEKFYSSALTKAEACVQLRLKRTECLIHLKKFDEAHTEAKFASSLEPDNYEILYFMSLCSFNKKDKNKALEYIEKSYAINSSDKRVHGAYILLRKDKDFILNVPKRMREKFYLETRSELQREFILFGKTVPEEEQADREREKEDACFGNSAESLIQKAYDCMELKLYGLALSNASNAISTDSKCLKGYVLIGECNTILGNVDEAVSAFEEAKKLDAFNKEVDKGIVKVFKLKNALKDGEKALKNNKFLLTYNNYKCASRIAHRNPAILLNVVECLIGLQNWSGFTSLLESVHSDLEKSPEYWCIKALHTFHMCDLGDLAVEFLGKAIGMDPSNEKYKKYLDVFQSTYDKRNECVSAYQNRNFDEALKLFTEGLEVASQSNIIFAEFNYYIGLIMLNQSKIDEAVEWFTKAIDLREYHADALEKRALCYKKLNRIKDAIEDYNILYKKTSLQTYKEIANDLLKLDGGITPTPDKKEP